MSFKMKMFWLVLGIGLTSCIQANRSDDLSEDTLEYQQSYLEKGKQIAQQTFEVLSGNLQAALQEGGVPKAIAYCNLRAMPLVDSLSEVHHALIRRTSLRVRNIQDKPSKLEKEVLREYLQDHQSGKRITPKIINDTSDSIHFVAPIMIKPLCLSCHGQIQKTMTQDNYDHILRYYPEDEAIGYELDEFRGIWSIKFEKK